MRRKIPLPEEYHPLGHWNYFLELAGEKLGNLEIIIDATMSKEIDNPLWKDSPYRPHPEWDRLDGLLGGDRYPLLAGVTLKVELAGRKKGLPIKQPFLLNEQYGRRHREGLVHKAVRDRLTLLTNRGIHVNIMVDDFPLGERPK